MQLLIGIDGGATKTRVVIEDLAGTTLAEDSAGPTNYQVVGVEQAGANLAAALQAALDSLPRPRLLSARMVVGLAGLDSPNDIPMIRALVTDALAQCPLSASWLAVNDAVIAWAGALGGEAGGIVISGSGAAALAVNPQGEIFHADGLGHWLGDEGSGFEIGRNGLRAAVRAWQGRGPATGLVAPMLAVAGGDVNGWAARLTEDGGLAHREMNRFVPPVVEAAQAGDAVSLAILNRAGRALAETGASVLGRAGLAETSTVATIGSLFAHAKPLRSAFCGRIEEILPGCQVIWPRMQPAEGALLLARRPEIVPQNALAVTDATREM